MPRFAVTRELHAQQWREGSDEIQDIRRIAPDETPVGISYNDKPHVVLMATATDLEDLAVGFTVTESIAVAVTAGVLCFGWIDDFVGDFLVASAQRETEENRKNILHGVRLHSFGSRARGRPRRGHCSGTMTRAASSLPPVMARRPTTATLEWSGATAPASMRRPRRCWTSSAASSQSPTVKGP